MATGFDSQVLCTMRKKMYRYSKRRLAILDFESQGLFPDPIQQDGVFILYSEAHSMQRMREWVDKACEVYGLGNIWVKRRKIRGRRIVFLRPL
jgi:hypothetical protein